VTLFAILNSVFFIVFLRAALRVTGTYPDSYVHSYVLPIELQASYFGNIYV